MDMKTLQDFVQPVPTCSPTTPLHALLDRFRQGGVQSPLVVVDQEQHPLGMISLDRLIAYLLPQASQTPPQLPPELSCPLIACQPPLIEPLSTLKAGLTLQQLSCWLQEQMPSESVMGDRPMTQIGSLGIVDAQGRFLGLLDLFPLLGYLAAAADLSPHCALPPSPREIVQLLLRLLEPLPLPLMLQTSSGQVLTQNLAWCQQVQELSDPQQITQAVAALLESDSPRQSHPGLTTSGLAPADAPSDASEVPQRLPSPLSRPALTEAPPFPEADAADSGYCQPGTAPDSWICTCPLRDGRERIWQFCRIPLQLISTAQGWSLETDCSPTQRHQFRLADLASPDPTAHPGEVPPLAVALQTAYEALSQPELLWLVMAQDVTDQRSRIKELEARNADLTQLNRLKDEFLAGISHEIKTPLTAILGLSSVLKEHGLGDLTERQGRYVRLIHQSGRQLMKVVNDILDLTRLATQQLELMPETIEIPLLCERVATQAKQLLPLEALDDPAPFPQLGPQLHLEIAPGLDFLVADGLRLRQMLMHLLSNALQFTEASGEVGLKVERWEGWIAFTVWDTGVGIPQQQQHLIFQGFQKLENPLSRHFQGTGLGLLVTQRLARLHGGDLTFTSEEGKGSVFTLLLPPYPNGDGSYRFGPLSDRLVLVMEADPLRLQCLLQQCETLGLRVVIARSGAEALEKARLLQPRVILLNPQLPLLSGWDALTLLKRETTTRSIPVVVMGLAAEQAQALQDGADGFLSWPIALPALQRTLLRLGVRVEGTPDLEIAPTDPADALSTTAPVSRPPPPAPTLPPLTILRLGSGDVPSTLVQDIQALIERSQTRTTAALPEANASELHFTHLLHLHDCRVLEADDLEQAELLARIWRPNVVLYDCIQANPLPHLQQLSHYPALAALPLVTLDVETTRAANQIAGLNVFPYLAPNGREAHSKELQSATLIKVLQIAAGY